VIQAVATSAGVATSPRQAVLESLITAFSANRVLLVLDNCEHLVQACAELVDQLVRACPRLRLLVTSREPLRVPGEITWPVAPLSLSPETVVAPQTVPDSDAVRLFVERAQAVLPGFELSEANATTVAEVCRRLDGLPLALELAAPLLRVLSPAELATRIDDRFRVLVRGRRTAPARQQTLESAVAWSYELLEPNERSLFAWLSVFPAGFTLDAAVAVSGLDSNAVLHSLANLVDQSLVVAGFDDSGGRRYSMLETLRAYGRERLRESGQEMLLQQRLLEWIADRADRAGAALRGPDQAQWLRWAEREHDNVRSALAWGASSGDAHAVMRIVAGLWWAWLLHHRWAEVHEWMSRALSMPGAEPHTLIRGRILHGAATTAAFRGEYRLAQTRLDECFSIAHELADDDLLLAAHSGQALLLQQQGAVEQAQSHAQRVFALAQRLDRPWYQARAAEFVAARALRTGDLSAAADHLNRAIELARQSGDSWNVAMLLGQLGDVERMRGTHPRAAPLYRESIRLFQTLGLREDPSRVHNLGYVALAQGQTAEAAELFLDALRVFRRVGDRRGIADCLIGVGCVRAAQRQPADAARLFGAGQAALDALGSVVWLSNRADYQHWERISRASLSSGAWEDAWNSVQVLGTEAIVDEVLNGPARAVRVPIGQPRKTVGELTPREREVARLAARSLSNRRIGETLVIAEKTAANHLQNALDKLDVHSRAELAARAVELGLIP
jgi:non-specific serine/threonine protein kinase